MLNLSNPNQEAVTVERAHINIATSIEIPAAPYSPAARTTDPITGERWATIPGYANSHIVSSFGRVRTLPRSVKGNGNGGYEIPGRELKARLHTGGQLIVGLNKDGKSQMKTVRQLVAHAFLEGGKPKATVDHLDGNPLNCRVDNLAWAEPKLRQCKG